MLRFFLRYCNSLRRKCNVKITGQAQSTNCSYAKRFKGLGALQTQCTAPGYTQNSVGTGSSFDAWTLGNIIFPLGIIVDTFTGATEKYPDHITVLMAKTSTKVAQKKQTTHTKNKRT